jgi:hypothetical protein
MMPLQTSRELSPDIKATDERDEKYATYHLVHDCS